MLVFKNRVIIVIICFLNFEKLFLPIFIFLAEEYNWSGEIGKINYSVVIIFNNPSDWLEVFSQSTMFRNFITKNNMISFKRNNLKKFLQMRYNNSSIKIDEHYLVSFDNHFLLNLNF